MSIQPENEKLEISQQAITELSNEQMEAITGGRAEERPRPPSNPNPPTRPMHPMPHPTEPAPDQPVPFPHFPFPPHPPAPNPEPPRR